MSYSRPSFLDTIPPIVKNLIAINIIMWLASIVSPHFLERLGSDASLTDFLGMHYWKSSQFNAIQLVTYLFLHDPSSIWHLLFNMWALYMFGSLLENRWGSKRFLTYYLVTGIGAGIVQQFFWTFELQPIINSYNEIISAHQGEAPLILKDLKLLQNAPITIGASGAIFGLLLAFGWYFPDLELYMFFIPIPIKAKYFVVIETVIELFAGVYQFSGDNIAHFAHLGGMLFGLIMILIWRKNVQI